MRSGLIGGSLIIFWFLLSYALSYQGIGDLLDVLFGSGHETLVPFLIFLPHGVRVIATYFAGGSAILPLFIAHILLYQIFGGVPQDTQVPLALIGSSCSFLAFEAMRFSNLNAYYRVDLPGSRKNNLGPPLLAGILAAILNAMGNLGFFLFIETDFMGLIFFIGYLIGDILGLLVILGILFSIQKVIDMIFKSQSS